MALFFKEFSVVVFWTLADDGALGRFVSRVMSPAIEGAQPSRMSNT
jgi:hypothetical protein